MCARQRADASTGGCRDASLHPKAGSPPGRRPWGATRFRRRDLARRRIARARARAARRSRRACCSRAARASRLISCASSKNRKDGNTGCVATMNGSVSGDPNSRLRLRWRVSTNAHAQLRFGSIPIKKGESSAGDSFESRQKIGWFAFGAGFIHTCGSVLSSRPPYSGLPDAARASIGDRRPVPGTTARACRSRSPDFPA